ncbi:hypothetical protein QR680_004453 [Steinernema hermaphroditum]|uniref:Malectin domain-containing protein n=1 Tax=Steinernema hermaphroditum TaxID=289476 RepID=A0AA39LU03_9BILA|nr:hypothetical protein QR680_004453 [Steinernema hermaphroditum]
MPSHTSYFLFFVVLTSFGQQSYGCFPSSDKEAPVVTTTTAPTTTPTTTSTTTTSTTTTTTTTTTTPCMPHSYNIIFAQRAVIPKEHGLSDRISEIVAQFDMGAGEGKAQFGARFAGTPGIRIKLGDYSRQESFMKEFNQRSTMQIPYGTVEGGDLLERIAYYDFPESKRKVKTLRKIVIYYLQVNGDPGEVKSYDMNGEFAKNTGVQTYVVYNGPAMQPDAYVLSGMRAHFVKRVDGNDLNSESAKEAYREIIDDILADDPCRKMKKYKREADFGSSRS